MAVPLYEPDNLLEFLERSVVRYPNRSLFGTKNAQGVYEWVTYAQVGRRVDNLRAGLAGLGVSRGDAVGIIANNREEWAIGAFASFGLGARWVPMYEAELLKVWRHIIRDSAVKVLFVSTPAIYEQVRDLADTTPTLTDVILVEGDGSNSMVGLERRGEEKPVPSIKPDPDDIAVLIYTSGTTGDPKGVLLSHGNITSNSHAGRKMYPELQKNHVITLAILPWAHSYGQTGELYTVIHLGGAIGLMESVKTLPDDMVQVKPTWLLAVPRVFNRIYDGLWAKVKEKGGIAKLLFTMGVKSAQRRRELARKRKTEYMTNLKFRIADLTVFRTIRNKLGGRLMGAMTASATMNPEISQFFFDIGIPLYDCYGMTEASPAVSVNSSVDYRLGTVGKPLEHVQVVIDPSRGDPSLGDGEICIYGPNVMKGYHNKPEETRAVMTEEGGLRTGDRGRLDDDGFLHITGRIKDQFKLENGKFVFPAALEEDICLNPFVEHAMILGEGKPHTVCLISPDLLMVKRYGTEQGRNETPEQLIQRPEVQERINQEITESLRGRYAQYEIPKRFLYLIGHFSLENGTLTQTMKVKRGIVLDQYREVIEALYTR